MGRIKEQVLLYQVVLIITIKEQVQDLEDLDPHKGRLLEEQEVLNHRD